ncbi:MAG: hypothetical protein CMB61_00815 [Euryarchaeota archaeon]|nr:hypothetical protein [Euryarchaeota archaeon]|tara:strand:+ start:19 stop:750 length:732 start_codon:yes stop_codon:yes gene_type:complete
MSSRRRWARITTGSSAILLLVAAISIWQISPEMIEAFDPENNNIVKLGPGEEVSLEIDSIVITALRISDSDSSDAQLTLKDENGDEIQGRNPNFIESSERVGLDGTIYVPVRVFEQISGEVTIQNNAEEGVLWLVDDEKSQSQIIGSMWFSLILIGCCLGTPVGIVGIVLALMTWADKKKSPDQFVVIEDGSVIITNSERIEDVPDRELAPQPFKAFDESTEEKSIGVLEEEIDESWKSWDEG